MTVLIGNRIAIIGAGAAGLVSAKIFLENGFEVTIYEQSSNVGGVWNYAESTAMYDSLHTNLPKEVMAFSIEDPFPESEDHSFLTHREVHSYLEVFAMKHSLLQHIRFHHSVQHVYKQVGSSEWTIEVLVNSTTSNTQYDAVIVCNGHFNIPFTPNDTPGFAHFTGECHHSSAYDRVKSGLAGKNVLVVGSMSSGTDMARELLSLATAVVVSDRSSASGNDIHTVFADVAPNLHLVSGIQCIQEDGSVLFTNGVVHSVDVILWCTGYLYDYPFFHTNTTDSNTDTTAYLNASNVNTTNTNTIHTNNANTSTTTSPATTITNTISTNTNPVRVPQQRCVRPLYQQLFSIADPSLVFIGLPFRVVPFPMFYYQAQYVAAVYTHRTALPNVQDQYEWLAAFEADKVSGSGMYSTKYHYLGGAPQWEYCRFLAVQSGLICDSSCSGGSGDSNTPTTTHTTTHTTFTIPATTHYTAQQHAQYLHMLETVYDDNMEHRVLYPGAPDTYRSRVYNVNRSDFSWTVNDGGF